MTAAITTAVVCQAAAVLLQYPDETLIARLPVVDDALRAQPPGDARSALLTVTHHLRTGQLRQLGENYVATFDRKRRCCLYLTWWDDGETRRRGQSLAALKDRYRRRGLELSHHELPDFLPVVLEYAATADGSDGLALLQEHRAGLELLRLALQEAGSVYVDVLVAICALLPGPSPADRAAAQRLKRAGPPVETVGLEPFGAPSARGPH
jgi:nitrate reductase delta subunit